MAASNAAEFRRARSFDGSNLIALSNDALTISTGNPSSDWAIAHLRPNACLQGNLDPLLVSTGGIALTDATRRMVNAFSQGPHIFNLGHGITPDANPAHVEQMLKAIRG